MQSMCVVACAHTRTRTTKATLLCAPSDGLSILSNRRAHQPFLIFIIINFYGHRLPSPRSECGSPHFSHLGNTLLVSMVGLHA